MINMVEPNGKIFYTNHAWQNNMGYTPEEAKDLNIIDLLPDDMKTGFEKRFENILTGNSIHNMNGRMITKSKKEIEVLGSIIPYYEMGQIVGTQMFFRNVTEINIERANRLKAEARLQMTLDSMKTGCMILSHNYTYLYVNTTAANAVFQSPENLLGKTMPAMFPGVEETLIFKRYTKAINEKKHLEFEEKYICSNGVTKWFEFQVDPIEEGIFIMTNDITERKVNEEELDKQQRLLKESQRITKLGSWEHDHQSNKVIWSAEMYNILEKDNFLDTPSREALLQLIPDEEKAYVLNASDFQRQDNKPYNIIYKLQFADGRIKYVKERGEFKYNENNIPVKLVGTLHDITEQREKELQIQLSEQRYKQVVENIHDGLIIRDKAAKLAYYNYKFLEIFALNPQDVDKKALTDFIAPEYREELNIRQKRRFSGESVPEFMEVEGIKSDGTRIWLEIRNTSIYNNKEIVAAQTIIRDITESKTARNQLELRNEELNKINSELDKFVYSTSHDLRAPLLSVLGLVNLCKEEEDKEELKNLFNMMESGIYRLDNTIKEILNYSRNSRMEVLIEKLDIRQMVNKLIESINYMEEAKNILFQIDIDDAQPFYNDYIRIKTIMSDLITNAIRYQRDNELYPFIKFIFKSTPKEGILSIEDNGEGIAKEKQQKIFEMFYRNSKKSVGSGLGLYICKEIVYKLNGVIELESQLGKGSTFKIRLPNKNTNHGE